jgi:hypothetical protein
MFSQVKGEREGRFIASDARTGSPNAQLLFLSLRRKFY